MTRVAIVHDWLTGMRGGERVLEGMLDLFPQAEIFTLFHLPGSVTPRIEARPIHASFLQHAPGLRRHYRAWLPLFPAAIESLELRGFELVLSSSHCVAKAARPRGAPHLCYCHTPARYIWDQRRAYRGAALGLPLVAAFRAWDRATTSRVDAFVANSFNVRDRIRRHWGRDARVVHPPVECERFRQPRAPEDFYLSLGALVPYKRVDLAIRACARLGRPLVVAGDGPELARLRRLAGKEVTFLGRVSDEEAADLLARCRALVFPGLEDFGITVVEAQAAGAPVVALAAGGALETLRGPVVARENGELQAGGRPAGAGAGAATGVFFAAPEPELLAAALLRLERTRFDERVQRAAAAPFDAWHFRAGLRHEIDRLTGAVPAAAHARAGG